MNQIRAIHKLSLTELENGIVSSTASWHHEYKDHAYVFVGGLHKELTEGDILTIFSQFGVPVDIKLVRDRETGESKGFGYLKYEDQRSTILAVDNLNGVKVAGRSLRVDHTFYTPRDGDQQYSEAVKSELRKDFESAHVHKPLDHFITPSEDNEFEDPMAQYIADCR
ncbi:LANO_0H19834g1_1 [Lachancea nothofagi CBS 11611]|uniref:LANO_0H19834g1_1 n=1 Tax=Lachancea nothofagi CBS 11611 TaxID=1266666 RepID=A0A1G4KNK0_9SACH|nr:LANO_0H19834g1_1 [Lachancea nothofagi CBS 11611]